MKLDVAVFRGLPVALLTLTLSQQVLAAAASFTGRILQIDVPGTGIYADVAVGTLFQGDFIYGSSVVETTSAPHFEPFEANYEFSGPSFLAALSHGASTVSGIQVGINIQNDHPVEAGEADFISALTGTAIATGTPIDVWTAAGLSSGAFELDPDPTDGDDTQAIFNGSRFEFALVSTDASLYSNLAFRPIPPALGTVDIGVFSIEQGDSTGNVVFSAFGTIESVAAIPEPESYALFLAGLGTLAVLGRLKRQRTRRSALPDRIA